MRGRLRRIHLWLNKEVIIYIHRFPTDVITVIFDFLFIT